MSQSESKGGILHLLIAIIILVGYIKNIVHLCECDFEPSYKAEVIYGVGTITGLGVITGYMDFGK